MREAYKKAGVNVEAGYEAVERIKKHTARTMRPEVLSGLGGFGGMFQLDLSRYHNPVLVSGTDGVGTKLKLAFALDRHDTIGIDAVAMCVNDIIVQGAEPLFFLDYFACGSLNPAVLEDVVKGISEGCVQAGCALIGGETAEMPGMYVDGEYDIAGFAVGAVDKQKLISGTEIQAGDIILGLGASGIHSNGFSLVRRLLLEEAGMDLNAEVEQLGKTLGEELLTPTKIYVKSILNALERFEIKGMAHITGGGFYENIPRILPETCDAIIEYGSWPILPIFELLQKTGELSLGEMFSTFNMGIGMVLIVPPGEEVEQLIDALKNSGESIYQIGQVVDGNGAITFNGVNME